jgi:hypothetical protein
MVPASMTDVFTPARARLQGCHMTCCAASGNDNIHLFRYGFHLFFSSEVMLIISVDILIAII